MSFRWLGYCMELRLGRVWWYVWFNPDTWEIKRWQTWNEAEVFTLGPFEWRWVRRSRKKGAVDDKE
jgi:hypothetical protein